MTQALDGLVSLNSAGALRQSSRNAIRRAVARAGREHKREQDKETRRQIGRHLDRMERVSSKVLRDDLIQLTTEDRATSLWELAKSKVRNLRSRMKAERRNVDLAVDVRKQHLDKTADAIIAALEGKGTKAERIARAKEAAREISELTKNRVDRIAAFDTDTIHSEQSHRLHVAAGIRAYKWVTQGDDRVRDEHEQREGQIFEWSAPPFDGHPGEPPNCRCSAEPVVPDPGPAPDTL